LLYKQREETATFGPFYKKKETAHQQKYMLKVLNTPFLCIISANS